MAETIRTIDIIIPTYKPGEKFLRLFAMLQKQTFAFHKLIVINTEEALMSGEIRAALLADSRTLIKDIRAEEFDHGATRDSGVQMSDADVFVCMTDDAVPADEYLLEKLAEALAQEDVSSAYARQLADDKASEAEKYTRVFNYPETGRKKSINDLEELGIKTYFSSNVCCAYKRRVYDELGGFVKKAMFNEDMIYACRAMKNGYSVVYKADAKVIHSHDYTAMQQFRRNFDLGISQEMTPEVFGGLKSEGEGIRLVKNTISHLIKKGQFVQAVVFVYRTAFRYAGFKAGHAYQKLPDALLLRFAMNKKFAEQLIRQRRQ